MVYNPKLVIVDGVTEWFAMHGLDVASATDVAKYQKMLMKRFSGHITTVEIDHVPKADNPNGRVTALGSQHKEAGMDGAVFEFRSVLHGGVGGTSTADIYLIKDREGYLNTLANKDRFIGTFYLDKDGARVEPNTGSEDHDAMDTLYKSVSETPQGNSTLAESTGIPVGTVRRLMTKLEQEGLVSRNDKQQWSNTSIPWGTI